MNCPKFHLHGRPASMEKFQQRLNEINPVGTLFFELN